MAGNVFDFTATAYSSNYRATCGYGYLTDSSNWYAGYRDYNHFSNYLGYYSSRLALYIPVSNAVGADEYVKSGLILHLDGLDNTKNGHNNSTTVWEDLSGNNNNGTIKGASWLNDGLYFDGVDDYVPIAELNYPEFTVEATFKVSKLVGNSDEPKVICNHNTGGFDIDINNDCINSFPYINGEYRNMKYDRKITVNKKYNVTMTTNGSESKLYVNGVLVSNISVENGSIGYPSNNSLVMLGANPNGSSLDPAPSFFNGAIYSVRMYNRVLTEQEVKNNHEVDRLRFGE